FSYLFSLLGSMVFAAAETDSPLLKGVLLVDESSKVREVGVNQIQGIQFDGVESKEELVAELSPFLSDLPLTANGAEALCAAITTYYHDHDDLRVAVTLPDQDTSEGVVQLVIAPERLGKLQVKDSKYTHPDSLKRWVRLSTADVINEKTLAQDLGWMNTNPYRTVTVDYKTSGQPGVTDVDLVVADKKNWKVLTGVENTGNNPIGTTRIYGGVNINNFLFNDHTLTLKATTADHYQEYQSYKGEYVALLPWRNTLKVSGSYSGATPERSPYPQKHRQSFQASTRYEIPQWFGSNIWVDQLTYQAGADFKGTNTNIFFEDDATPVKKELAFIGQFAAGVSALRARESNKITAGIDLIGSPARMLPHQTDADFDNLRQGARPQYFYSKLALALEQKLVSDWNLFVQGRGQFAFAELIPSEQFTLGGYSTVRGYDENVVGGDHAICGNLEVRTPEFTVAGIWLPKFADKLHFLGFVDGGYAWLRKEVAGTPMSQGLASIGPGMRYSVASNFSSRLDLGFPLTNVEKDSGKPHIHFNANLSY
ncbi:MAG: BamA/TamA family outer membrane protein, partial [Verrucomicrobia bacterium]|nr:BamA/TamA family outer membrane protein [Verrucomicrobiota bacterium]